MASQQSRYLWMDVWSVLILIGRGYASLVCMAEVEDQNRMSRLIHHQQLYCSLAFIFFCCRHLTRGICARHNREKIHVLRLRHSIIYREENSIGLATCIYKRERTCTCKYIEVILPFEVTGTVTLFVLNCVYKISFPCTYCSAMLVSFADDTNCLYLKLTPSLQQPPTVHDYHVPIFICSKDDIDTCGDLTIHQVHTNVHVLLNTVVLNTDAGMLYPQFCTFHPVLYIYMYTYLHLY